MTVTVSDRWYDDVVELLGEVAQYMEQRADAEYFTDSPAPVPNEEMMLFQDATRLHNLTPWPRDVERRDGKEMG